MLQLTVKIDNENFRKELSEDIVLRQKARYYLGGTPNARDDTDNVFNSNFDGSIDEVLFAFSNYGLKGRIKQT